MLTLGFVLYGYFPFGGLQRDCLNIARACVRRGHRVLVLTRTWEGDRPEGIEVALLGRQGWTNTGRNLAFIESLRTALPRHGTDGVVGFNKMPGLDLYYGADTCTLAKIRRTQPRWAERLPHYRRLIEQERAVFDAGSRTQILLITPREIPLYAEFYGTATDRFHLLPPPLVRQDTTPEFREATRQKVRREQGWREEERVMLLVGSDYRRKGLDRILLALASLPVETRTRARLAVIGKDNPDPFKRQARRLGVLDRVQFLGARLDAPEFMMAADLLVHTAYTENTGTVLLEALTFGLPVLTHDTCGFAHHIA
jgi:UDP-glucose:(heptosyl)LPS alpha-1,3-glucosyltransferase